MKTNILLTGDAFSVLKTFPNESIDCVITSPPYWSLRDYQLPPQIWDGDGKCEHKFPDDNIKRIRGNVKNFTNKPIVGSNANEYQSPIQNNGAFCSLCGAWRGSLGLEPTFKLYLKHLLQIFDEIKRVLKKSGTCWVNLGDPYAGSGNGTNDYRTDKNKSIQGKGKYSRPTYQGLGSAKLSAKAAYNETARYEPRGQTQEIPTKSLCLIPFRFAIEMVNRDTKEERWSLRNTIIWHKPNCMPSSAKDRFTVDFEYVFFFVKNKNYYFRQQSEPALSDDPRKHLNQKKNFGGKWDGKIVQKSFSYHSTKRNKRTVWSIMTKPFPGSHFAVFPEKLIEPMILAGCPPNGIVLDPFVGSGTTCLIAKKFGRQYVGIDLNPDYIEMARKRLAEIPDYLFSNTNQFLHT